MKTHLFKLYMSELRKRRKKTALITFAIGWGGLKLGLGRFERIVGGTK